MVPLKVEEQGPSIGRTPYANVLAIQGTWYIMKISSAGVAISFHPSAVVGLLTTSTPYSFMLDWLRISISSLCSLFMAVKLINDLISILNNKHIVLKTFPECYIHDYRTKEVVTIRIYPY